MRQARDELQALLDGATQVAITATDAQGTLTLFSAGAERMLGYSALEVLGTKAPLPFHLESEVVARTAELAEAQGTPGEMVAPPRASVAPPWIRRARMDVRPQGRVPAHRRSCP